MAVLVDLVLPIQYPEAGSGVREGSIDIHIMALVTIRLTGIRMSTHILAQVMLLIPSIPTVIEDEGNQIGMPLERRRERCILGLDFGTLGEGIGYGMPYGYPYGGYGYPHGYGYPGAMPNEEEIRMLEDQERGLTSELEGVRKRLSELRGQ